MLGDSESSPFLTRPRLVPGVPPAVEVVLDRAETCARTASGELWCWGQRSATTVEQRANPTRIAQAVRYAALDRENHQKLHAAPARGAVWSLRWGAGSTSRQAHDLGDITALATGDGWGCGVNAGELRCFSHRTQPAWLRRFDERRPAMHLSSAVVSLSIAGMHGCIALADGRALCWGESAGPGELGPEVGTGRSVPIAAPVVVTGLPPVDAIAIGDRHTCARSHTGELWCWGDASDGRLGGPARGKEGQPQQVVGLPPMAQVAVGGAHTCATTEAGQVWCWGRNDRGQLGRGVVSPPSPLPAPVPGLAGVSAVALAGDTSCAVTAEGVVHCWGDNLDRHANPMGPLRSEHALPVDMARVQWVDTP